MFAQLAAQSLSRQALQDKLIKLSEDHPGFAGEILEFDPAAKSYRKVGLLPQPAPVTAPAIVWNNDLLILSGEVRAGVRSSKVWLGHVEASR